MLATSTSDIRVLPPTEDAFYFHVLRSLYQIYLYMMASKDSTTIITPVNFGPMIQTKKFVPIMISKTSKPDLERFVYCNCGISSALRTGLVQGCLCNAAKHINAWVKDISVVVLQLMMTYLLKIAINHIDQHCGGLF